MNRLHFDKYRLAGRYLRSCILASMIINLYACGGAGGAGGASSSSSQQMSSLAVPSSMPSNMSSRGQASSQPNVGLNLKAPQGITVEATGPLTSVSLGTAMANGGNGNLTIVNNAPANGFPLGATTVTWTVTDATGQKATATQAVRVSDTKGPTITPPAAITVTQGSASFTKIDLGTATAEDVVDGTLSVMNNAPVNGFPVGATTVTWVSQDKSGNGSTATQLVKVNPNTPVDIRGKKEYEAQCANCHDITGKGGIYSLKNDQLNVTQMVNVIRETMPKGNPNSCGQTCSEDVTDYIKNVLFATKPSSVSSSSSSSKASSKPSSQATSSGSSRASSSAGGGLELDPVKIKAGQREWEAQCDTCHGFAGEGTAAFNKAINVSKFTKASLIEKIVKDMPPLNPESCGVTCAQNVAEFILSNYKRDDGATNPGTLQCKAGELNKHKNSPIRLLTSEQYAKLIKSVFAPLNINTAAIMPEHLLKDTALAGFESNSGIVVDVNIMPDLMEVAEAVAKQANANFSKLMTCSINATCATNYITQYGTLLFRGAPTSQEMTDLNALYTLGGAAKGIEYVTTAMLMSPKTLYQYEEAVTTRSLLKGREIAHKLSFLIWNSTPDAALLQAAQNGSLNTPAGIIAEANRMLDAAQGVDGLRYFYGNLLHLDPKKNIQQGNTTVSAQQISDDIVRFVSYLTRKTPGTYADLLTSTKAVVDDSTAVIYGVPSAQLTNAPSYMGGKEVNLDPKQRAGLLTRIGYVILGGGRVEGLASPTERGKQVREAMLCQGLPSAPADVEFPELPDPSKKTWVEVLKDVHLANPESPCYTCHVLMDPLGFAFENYSNTGRYIGLYPSNRPIDSTGQFYAINSDKTDLDNARFNDALDLSKLLSTSDKAKACFAEKWMTNALARDVMNQEDSCAYEQLLADFKAKNYSLRELILAVVTNPSFRYRNPE